MTQDYDHKVAIAVPSMEMWHADFAIALNRLVQRTLIDPYQDGKSIGFVLLNERSSLLPNSRHDLVMAALKVEATHILWLDSDMNFPPDALHQLLAHDLDCVGANYVRRTLPCLPISAGLDEKRMYTRENSKGLEAASHMGFGVLLMKTAMLVDLGKPWFAIEWQDISAANPDGGYIGEDVYLFHKMRDKGYVGFVDHDLSKDVGHIGTYQYNHEASSQWS